MKNLKFDLDNFINPDKIVSYEDCLKCRKCCIFPKSIPGGAPIITKSEFKSISLAEEQRLKVNGLGENTFQFVLISDNDFLKCPFLKKSSYQCEIYGRHPFDCRIFPFMLVRRTNKSGVYLSYDKTCLAIVRIKNLPVFINYCQELLNLFSTRKARVFFKKYPELILNERNLGKYMLGYVGMLSWDNC